MTVNKNIVGKLIKDANRIEWTIPKTHKQLRILLENGNTIMDIEELNKHRSWLFSPSKL